MKPGNMESDMYALDDDNTDRQNNKKNKSVAMNNAIAGKNMLSQVVGIIIGSPEFQRR